MNTTHPVIEAIDWDDLQWELDPLIGTVDWTALGWGLELSRIPQDSRKTNPNHQLLMLWYRTGIFTGKPEEKKKLRLLVVDWGGIPFAKRTIPGVKYPLEIMVPLIDAFVATRNTKQRPKQAAMQIVRSFDPDEIEALRSALRKLARGQLRKSLQGRLGLQDEGRVSLLCDIGEAFDLLMRDVEDHVFGAAKASIAGLLGT